MKHIVIYFLLSSFAICSTGRLSAQSFTEVANETDLISKIKAAAEKISTIQCDFIQEKSIQIMDDKLVSKGKFSFSRVDKVRLEYTSPKKSTIIMNGGQVLLSEEGKVTKSDIRKNRAYQQLNKIIVGAVSGDIFSGKEFAVRLFENGSQVKAEFVPNDKTVRNFITYIVIFFEKKDFTAARIEIHETGGDSTVLLFSQKRLNQPIEAGIFTMN